MGYGIGQRTTSDVIAYGIKSVTTSATRLTTTKLPSGSGSGVLIKAPGPTDPTPNTASVFIGASNVTADQNAQTGGFPLAPGESVTLPVDNADGIYVIAAASQKLNWIMV